MGKNLSVLFLSQRKPIPSCIKTWRRGLILWIAFNHIARA